MKKIFAFTLVGILSLSVLTACGSERSKEEKAAKEIRQHMIEEAEEDGADLPKKRTSTEILMK